MVVPMRLEKGQLSKTSRGTPVSEWSRSRRNPRKCPESPSANRPSPAMPCCAPNSSTVIPARPSTRTAGLLAGPDLIEFLRGHDAAVIGAQVMDEAVFAAVPELRVVSKWGVGMNTLDLAAMARHGVRLGWTAGVNRLSVAELALSLRHFPVAPRAGGQPRSRRRDLAAPYRPAPERPHRRHRRLRPDRQGTGPPAGAVPLPDPRPRHPRLRGILPSPRCRTAEIWTTCCGRPRWCRSICPSMTRRRA